MRRVRHATLALALVFAWLVVGCGSESSGTGRVEDDATGTEDVSGDATLPSDTNDDSADPFDKPDGQGSDSTAPPSCTPGERRCLDDQRAAECMPDGNAWAIDTCPAGLSCVDGECTSALCAPYSRRCIPEGNGWTACDASGSGWLLPVMCEGDAVCIEGVCLERTCTPGTIACGEGVVLICGEDGITWKEASCPEGTVCFGGACVECVNDDQCDDGTRCIEGVCAAAPVAIVPDTPPLGTVGYAYRFALRARGGRTPYAWTVTGGALPGGLALSTAGVIEGTPTTAGMFTFDVAVEDANAMSDTATLSIEIDAQGAGVRITTASPLPQGEDGFAYDVQLQATGGTEPYAWMLSAGALPAGLSMDWAGRITGTPNMSIGEFPFTVRVFDNSTPPTWDEKEFSVFIKIAPLEIYGERQVDLWVTKVILLPLLTFIEGVPILPYNTQLTARGGLRPYHWSEIPLPSILSFLIPRSGIPAGLTLADDGTLSGTVTSTEQVISIQIPFTEFSLQGFFFVGQVADSQSPAESKWALFLIPTVPIGF